MQRTLLFGWLLGLVGVGCGGSGVGPSDAGGAGDARPMGDAGDDDARPVEDAGVVACVSTSSSTLPGVSIEIHGNCHYGLAQAARGIHIEYTVTSTREIPNVRPDQRDSGKCDQPDGLGLIVRGGISGGGNSYCVCDVGPCLRSVPTGTVHVGQYTSSLDWDGRNWSGPSDTLDPKGPAFPAGTYTFSVYSSGSVDGRPYTISATADVVLVP